MKLVSIRYEVANTHYDTCVLNSELDRNEHTSYQYIQRHLDYLTGIELVGNVAVLYAGGVGMHQSEARNVINEKACDVALANRSLTIKEISAFMMHRYIGILAKKNKITFANINSNTCASSMYSLYEAERLLRDKVVDHVVIITEEKTSYGTIQVFSESRIPVKAADGFAIAVLSVDGVGIDIGQCKWEYSYNNNPFAVSYEAYDKLQQGLNVDMVKVHGTGTGVNSDAEKCFTCPTIEYKSQIGHSQGASGLVEIGMLLDDDNAHGRILCVASGLGGFYGSCVVTKP